VPCVWSQKIGATVVPAKPTYYHSYSHVLKSYLSKNESLARRHEMTNATATKIRVVVNRATASQRHRHRRARRNIGRRKANTNTRDRRGGAAALRRSFHSSFISGPPSRRPPPGVWHSHFAIRRFRRYDAESIAVTIMNFRTRPTPVVVIVVAYRRRLDVTSLGARRREHITTSIIPCVPVSIEIGVPPSSRST
jgi:hypothetical protein